MFSIQEDLGHGNLISGWTSPPQPKTESENLIFDKMPEGEWFPAPARYLYSLLRALANKDCGSERTYVYFVGASTFFEFEVPVRTAFEVPVRFSDPQSLLARARRSEYK